MERKSPNFPQTSILVVLLLFFAFAGYSLYMYNLDKFVGNSETHVLGTGSLLRGGNNSLRIVVLSHTDQKPIKNARVKAEIIYGSNHQKKLLFRGKTDSHGTLEASFTLPQDFKENKATLRVSTSSGRGHDSVEHAIDIRSACELYLTTDKNLYKPGQTIHMRLMALSRTDLTPVKDEATFEVLDPKGNKVFKKRGNTSDFGISSADFVLGDDINLGNYRVKVSLGQDRAERTVEVKKYVLPKFKVALSTDKSFYEPMDTVKGTVRAEYFFGKPVSGAKIWIDLSTLDVARQRITKIQGTTDGSGNFAFSLRLPEYFTGTPLEQGRGVLMFQVTAMDSARHREMVTQSVPVSKDQITV